MAKWIIVVDDDMSNLKIAGHILSKNQMRVTCLKSGKALINYIGEGNRPDLILLDIMMPEMDGFETLTRLREKEKELDIEEIPVIFLTATDDEESENYYIYLRSIIEMQLEHVKELSEKEEQTQRLKSSIDSIASKIKKD